MFVNPPSIERFNLRIETDFLKRKEENFEVPIKLNPRWTPYKNHPRLLFWGYRKDGTRLPLDKRSSSKTVKVLSHREGEEAELYGDVEVFELFQEEGIRFILPSFIGYNEEVKIRVHCQNQRASSGWWEDELLLRTPPSPPQSIRLKNEFYELRSAFGSVMGEALGILGGIAANPLLK